MDAIGVCYGPKVSEAPNPLMPHLSVEPWERVKLHFTEPVKRFPSKEKKSSDSPLWLANTATGLFSNSVSSSTQGRQRIPGKCRATGVGCSWGRPGRLLRPHISGHLAHSLGGQQSGQHDRSLALVWKWVCCALHPTSHPTPSSLPCPGKLRQPQIKSTHFVQSNPLYIPVATSRNQKFSSPVTGKY